MITEEQAIELLHKYDVPEKIINHCKAVAKTAMELVEEKNIECDKEKLKIACLLHDIGRVKVLRGSDNPEFGDNRHEPYSVEILEKEGLPEIVKIVSKHGYMLAFQKLEDMTIEEKILVVADSITKEDERISVKERSERVLQKYIKNEDYKALERFKKSIPIHEKIVKELGVE